LFNPNDLAERKEGCQLKQELKLFIYGAHCQQIGRGFHNIMKQAFDYFVNFTRSPVPAVLR
jgi:hypothetical protein